MVEMFTFFLNKNGVHSFRQLYYIFPFFSFFFFILVVVIVVVSSVTSAMPMWSFRLLSHQTNQLQMFRLLTHPEKGWGGVVVLRYSNVFVVVVHDVGDSDDGGVSGDGNGSCGGVSYYDSDVVSLPLYCIHKI